MALPLLRLSNGQTVLTEISLMLLVAISLQQPAAIQPKLLPFDYLIRTSLWRGGIRWPSPERDRGSGTEVTPTAQHRCARNSTPVHAKSQRCLKRVGITRVSQASRTSPLDCKFAEGATLKPVAAQGWMFATATSFSTADAMDRNR